jgi:hypothetical protein
MKKFIAIIVGCGLFFAFYADAQKVKSISKQDGGSGSSSTNYIVSDSFWYTNSEDGSIGNTNENLGVNVTGPLAVSTSISGNTVVATLSVTSATVETGTLTVNTAVAQGTGMQHERITTGAIAPEDSVPITITWDTPFPDINYTVVVSVEQSDEDLLTLYVDHIEVIEVGAVTVRIQNRDTLAAKTGILHAIAMHD